MWPKATLGCLRDGVRLTPEQLASLLRVCEAHRPRLAAAPPLPVSFLQLVLFKCRSLERLLSATCLQLAAPADASRASEEERIRAALVHAESNTSAYWFHVARDGGREAHYRADAAGATLVAPLGAAAASALNLASFRAAVDEALPGMYAWFDDTSLHMTVRALL